jgi:hypothetical protein
MVLPNINLTPKSLSTPTTMDFSTPPTMTVASRDIKVEQPDSEDQQMSESVPQNGTAKMLPEFSGQVGRSHHSAPATLEESIRSIRGYGTEHPNSSGMFDEAIFALGKIDTANIVRGKRRSRGTKRERGDMVNRNTTEFTMGERQRDGELERSKRPSVTQAREYQRSKEEKRRWAKEKLVKEEAYAKEKLVKEETSAMENAMDSMSFDSSAVFSQPTMAKPVNEVSFTSICTLPFGTFYFRCL